eukprot:10096910-Alexandrium_andersonii.AAC.1
MQLVTNRAPHLPVVLWPPDIRGLSRSTSGVRRLSSNASQCLEACSCPATLSCCPRRQAVYE